MIWIVVLMLNYDCYTPNAFWLVYTAQLDLLSMGIRHASWHLIVQNTLITI